MYYRNTTHGHTYTHKQESTAFAQYLEISNPRYHMAKVEQNTEVKTGTTAKFH